MALPAPSFSVAPSPGGTVIPFSDISRTAQRATLVEVLADLHALITLDPATGASPVRIYFVMNPVAKQRIAETLGAGAPPPPRGEWAFALVAFDFPFALHVVKTSSPRLTDDRAKAIVRRAADLQGPTLREAAEASGLDARPLPDFDAEALKAVFFPNTQETVAHVFRLALRPEPRS